MTDLVAHHMGVSNRAAENAIDAMRDLNAALVTNNWIVVERCRLRVTSAIESQLDHLVAAHRELAIRQKSR